jgi:Tol biopolymer transport system component
MEQPASEGLGIWTPDGKYFVFHSQRGETTNIWAIREGGSLFRRVSHEPAQLTTGPASTFAPLPSMDGKKLFVITVQSRGQLVRYDSASHQFIPYLSGASVRAVQLSPDREWITYITYPQGILYKSKPDGSDPLQLTFPPLHATMPRWSPDGTRIAFFAQEPGKPWRVHVISAEGGSPEQVVPERALFPTWSPDGNSLLIARNGLELVNLQTHTVSKVPGSQELWGPGWSPDGRHIFAFTNREQWPMLFDVKTQKWAALPRIEVHWPEWSHHSDSIYFLGVPPGGEQGIFRFRIGGAKLEQVVSLKDFHFAPETWVGLAPDDSPLLLRDAGTQDIYALDVDFP